MRRRIWRAAARQLAAHSAPNAAARREFRQSPLAGLALHPAGFLVQRFDDSAEIDPLAADGDRIPHHVSEVDHALEHALARVGNILVDRVDLLVAGLAPLFDRFVQRRVACLRGSHGAQVRRSQHQGEATPQEALSVRMGQVFNSVLVPPSAGLAAAALGLAKPHPGA